jgi:AP-1 complex subunit mu
MVASAVYIMDLKGKVIISRNYRGDIPMNASDKFSLHIGEKDEMDLRPVFTLDGVTYAYIKVSM